MKLDFEAICVGNTSKLKIENQSNLLHLLASNCQLWKDPTIKKNTIEEADGSLICKIIKITSGNEDSEVSNVKFLINTTGTYNYLEPFRIKILSFLKEQGFEHIYILKDDISKQISCRLYPMINELESSLRGYLIRFFVEKLGVKWWDMTTDPDMRNKVIQRKNNERDFSQYIDNKVYLIDFGDLGKIIYSLSYGSISRDDILKKIESLEETPKALKALKQDLQSNYNKFFKTNFKDNKFQQKWESVEKIRNKVAHNNLFTQSDLNEAELNFQEITQIINRAKEEIETINLTEQEVNRIFEHSPNELYGNFMTSWIALEKLMDEIIKITNITESNYIHTTLDKINFLVKFGILERDLLHKMHVLRIVRNQLVHGVDEELTEDKLIEALVELNKTILKLELVKNKNTDS